MWLLNRDLIYIVNHFHNNLQIVRTVHSNQAGGWSQEGLRLDNSSTDTRITCLTTHLTSFAVLVSVRGTKVRRYN